MDKAEHGKRLRQAMAERALSRQTLADAVGVNVKTVTNWRSGATMPDPDDRAYLRRLLGAYDAMGDPVEIAVRNSELIDWRQDAVISIYKKNLHEQRGEATA